MYTLYAQQPDENYKVQQAMIIGQESELETCLLVHTFYYNLDFIGINFKDFIKSPILLSLHQNLREMAST